MQDTIVVQVAELLELELRPEERRILTLGGTTVPGAYDFYLQGLGYLKREATAENIDYAVDLFNRALERDSGYALALAGLGEAYWRRYTLTKDVRWVELARRTCEDALKLNDQLAPVHVTLALIDTGTGRYEDAVEKLERALEIDPVNDQAYRQLGRAFEQLSRTADAEATYRKAIQMRPNQSGNHMTLGVFYYRMGRYEEAAEQFLTITELAPDNALAFANLGGMYSRLNRMDEAQAMYERSLAIRETYEASNNLATLYFDRGRYAEAAREFERAVGFHDRDYRLWKNLASASHWAGDSRRADEAFGRATVLGEQELEVNPRRAGLLIDLADCHSMLGNAGRAREYFQRAIGLEPRDVNVIYHAAIVKEQLGDREEALEWLGKALGLGHPLVDAERSPSLARLRRDSRYRALLARLDR